MSPAEAFGNGTAALFTQSLVASSQRLGLFSVLSTRSSCSCPQCSWLSTRLIVMRHVRLGRQEKAALFVYA
jgi:hypothetical protein